VERIVERTPRRLGVRRSRQSSVDLVEGKRVAAEGVGPLAQRLDCRGRGLVIALDRSTLAEPGLASVAHLDEHRLRVVGGVAGDDERLGQLHRRGSGFKVHAGSVISVFL
jgi:hypothetical protein